MRSPSGDEEAKVVLITGCSSGLGQALAEVMHTAAGRYRVIATARREESLAPLAAAGIKCIGLDVTDSTSVTRAVAEIIKEEQKIDILINNAGLSRFGPIAEQDISEIEEILSTNVIGVVRLCQTIVPLMASRGKGLIINIGSVTSQMTTPWSGAYAASKAALRSITSALRLEVAPFGIDVTYCCAGSIRSAFGDNSMASSNMHSYKHSASLYNNWVESIAQRAQLSQADGCMSALDVACQILQVVERTCIESKWKSPPSWFLVGGKALYYWFVGLVQMTIGWPVNGMLASQFKLLPPS